MPDLHRRIRGEDDGDDDMLLLDDGDNDNVMLVLDADDDHMDAPLL